MRNSFRGGTNLKNEKDEKEKKEEKMECIGGYHSKPREKESIILCTAVIFSSERVQS